MSVYWREAAGNFAAALGSLCGQLLEDDELIIVKDGPLTSELESVLTAFSGVIVNLRIVSLPVNVGLARALNAGLMVARHAWIMRFDSDDICLPERVSTQRLSITSNSFDLFGAQIEEFEGGSTESVRLRMVPVNHQDIVAFAKRRNPFNHMTVCFRRDLALKSGGYPEVPLKEDYCLWIAMISLGARTMNDPRILAKARVGADHVARRGGLYYASSEYHLQRFMIERGFKTLPHAVFDGMIRSFLFLLPASLRNILYLFVLRDRSF
jgi:glycosyltransferase involved in cell wall biosynthesis